jgi:hypothetical protein
VGATALLKYETKQNKYCCLIYKLFFALTINIIKADAAITNPRRKFMLQAGVIV